MLGDIWIIERGTIEYACVITTRLRLSTARSPRFNVPQRQALVVEPTTTTHVTSRHAAIKMYPVQSLHNSPENPPCPPQALVACSSPRLSGFKELLLNFFFQGLQNGLLNCLSSHPADKVIALEQVFAEEGFWGFQLPHEIGRNSEMAIGIKRVDETSCKV